MTHIHHGWTYLTVTHPCCTQPSVISYRRDQWLGWFDKVPTTRKWCIGGIKSDGSATVTWTSSTGIRVWQFHDANAYNTTCSFNDAIEVLGAGVYEMWPQGIDRKEIRTIKGINTLKVSQDANLERKYQWLCKAEEIKEDKQQHCVLEGLKFMTTIVS